MKGTRYSEEQIIRILRELEEGKRVSEVCRDYGVSEQASRIHICVHLMTGMERVYLLTQSRQGAKNCWRLLA